MWKYLKGYGLCAAVAPFMKLAEALMELYIPVFVQKVIDEGVTNKDKKAVVLNCLMILLFGILGLAFSVTSQWFSARSAVGYTSALRKDLYRKAVTVSNTEIDKIGQSALITRLTADTDKIQSGINMGLRLLLRSPFVVFGSAIMAMTISVKIGAVFFGVIAVLSAIVFYIVYGGIPYQSNASKKLENVTGKTRDNLHGVRIIRAFGHEDEEIELFEKANDEHANATIKAGRFSSFLNPLTFSVINVGIIFVINMGAVDVSTGTLKQGEVVALYNYMAQILTELVKLATLTLTLSRAIACGKRVKKILDIPEEKALTISDFTLPTKECKLEFQNVSFKYASSKENALTGISFTLGDGESIGILGGTGSGKSTLASLIAGLYRPTGGNILLDGTNIVTIDPELYRAYVSMVPQHAKLFSGTIYDNIKRGRLDATEDEIKAALSSACALDFCLEKGLECEVLKDGANFSGGQKQRLTIARAILKNTEILVLDDSLSALDFKTDLEVRRNIANLEPKPATVIISQRPSSVMQCDKILVLDDGVCVGIGTHEELLATCEEYKEIYESQYGDMGGETNG